MECKRKFGKGLFPVSGFVLLGKQIFERELPGGRVRGRTSLIGRIPQSATPTNPAHQDLELSLPNGLPKVWYLMPFSIDRPGKNSRIRLGTSAGLLRNAQLPGSPAAQSFRDEGDDQCVQAQPLLPSLAASLA